MKTIYLLNEYTKLKQFEFYNYESEMTETYFEEYLISTLQDLIEVIFEEIRSKDFLTEFDINFDNLNQDVYDIIKDQYNEEIDNIENDEEFYNNVKEAVKSVIYE